MWRIFEGRAGRKIEFAIALRCTLIRRKDYTTSRSGKGRVRTRFTLYFGTKTGQD